MSEEPVLPESEDPFEILGVPRDVDAAALRRAYVARIRVFRPERQPQAFARVRQAYDEALAHVRWREQDTTAHALAPEAAPGGPGDEIAERIGRAWEQLGDGASAAQVLLGLHEPRQDELLAAHRVLLGDAVGLGVREEVLSALTRGRPIARALVPLLDPAEVLELLREDAFDWPGLTRQPDRAAAAWLFNLRSGTLLYDDRLDDAVQAVLAEDYVREAEMQRMLAWTGAEVRAVAAWVDHPGMDALDRHYAMPGAAEAPLLSPEDVRSAANMLRVHWTDWTRAYPSMRAARRLFRLAPVLEGPHLRLLREEAAAEFLDRPHVYVPAFRNIARAAPELLERFVAAAQRAGPRDPSEDIPPLGSTLAGLRRVLGRSSLGEAGFAERVLPELTRLVVTAGLDPEAIAAHLEHHAADWPRKTPLATWVRRERSLYALHACHELARA